MKIILFFLIIFSVAYESHAQMKFICKKTPLMYNRVMACPKHVPAEALHKMFKDNFPEISYQKITYDNGEIVSVFGTVNHAFYLKESKDHKILELYQGLKDSDCHYSYKIRKAKNGLRYCEAAAPKKFGLQCLKKHATDPIRNPKNQRLNCDAFIEAMQACAKDDAATQECKRSFYTYMNIKDNGKPVPNPHNKPLPASESGIVDNGDQEFCGEPDSPPCGASSTRAKGAK